MLSPGETVVGGTVNPDEWYVFKPTLAEGKQAIVSRALGSKEIKMVYKVQWGYLGYLSSACVSLHVSLSCVLELDGLNREACPTLPPQAPLSLFANASLPAS